MKYLLILISIFSLCLSSCQKEPIKDDSMTLECCFSVFVLDRQGNNLLDSSSQNYIDIDELEITFSKAENLDKINVPFEAVIPYKIRYDEFQERHHLSFIAGPRQNGQNVKDKNEFFIKLAWAEGNIDIISFKYSKNKKLGGYDMSDVALNGKIQKHNYISEGLTIIK